MMNEKTERFKEKFANLARKYQKFCFMSCASELQLEGRKSLELLKKEAEELKNEAIVLKDEDSANALLAFELMVDAITNELKMWVALKKENPHAAWHDLVDAQIAAGNAIRVHEVAQNLGPYIDHLDIIESILFPPQMFFSPGMKIKRASCSICGQTYGECTHVRGKAYMGELCARRIEECELEEVSIVPSPANKEARLISFEKRGTKIDTMTGRIISDEPKK
jgi:hypothetical protein